MVEKPIAVDVETTRKVVEAAKTKPHLKFLVPFCRRCELWLEDQADSQLMIRTAL